MLTLNDACIYVRRLLADTHLPRCWIRSNAQDRAADSIEWLHHDEASVGCMECRASVKQQLLRGTSLCMMKWYMGISCHMDVCWSAVGM